MPLPLILGIGAAIAAVGGVGSGIHGAAKMIDAKDTMRIAKETQEEAIRKFEKNNDSSTKLMDSIGTQELNILNSFEMFSDLIEKIQGRPEFKQFNRDGVELPKYEPSKLKEVSTGAGLLLGGLGGAAAGTVGGFAAAGAATSAVMALGTASTGTAIASLSGAALTNATLAALGGGAIGSAAGAGGMALGTTILGATTAGVGLLVGGIIFGITGSKLSDKADEALSQAMDTEEAVDKVCSYLSKLCKYARKFKKSLSMVENCYKEHIEKLNNIINNQGKTQWNEFTSEEKKITENSVLLVGLLYKMCQVKLVLKDKDDGQNEVNVKGVMDIESDADKIIENEVAA